MSNVILTILKVAVRFDVSKIFVQKLLKQKKSLVIFTLKSLVVASKVYYIVTELN